MRVVKQAAAWTPPCRVGRRSLRRNRGVRSGSSLDEGRERGDRGPTGFGASADALRQRC